MVGSHSGDGPVVRLSVDLITTQPVIFFGLCWRARRQHCVPRSSALLDSLNLSTTDFVSFMKQYCKYSTLHSSGASFTPASLCKQLNFTLHLKQGFSVLFTFSAVLCYFYAAKVHLLWNGPWFQHCFFSAERSLSFDIEGPTKTCVCARKVSLPTTRAWRSACVDRPNRAAACLARWANTITRTSRPSENAPEHWRSAQALNPGSGGCLNCICTALFRQRGNLPW